MSNFDIFKQNQVLYIEYGIIYVILICLMIVLPLAGLTHVISSVILLWLFTALLVLVMNQNIKKELDFGDLFQDKRLPSKLKLFLISIAVLVITSVEVILFKNQIMGNWLLSITLTIITILQSLLISLFVLKKINLFLNAIFYCISSVLLIFLTIIFGGIFFSPFIFIILFKKGLN
jgi:hypothetical protein